MRLISLMFHILSHTSHICPACWADCVLRSPLGKQERHTFPILLHKRYRVVSRDALGSGAYGVVIVAEDTWKQNEEVVLKVLLRSFGDPTEDKKAVREILILKHLRHPNGSVLAHELTSTCH